MKPSDSKAARLVRVHKYRRGQKIEGWVRDINEIAACGQADAFFKLAHETGIRPKPYLRLIDNLETEPQLKDCWGVATGEWLQELGWDWPRPEYLAAQAVRRELNDPGRGDERRYRNKWSRSDGDWGQRLQRQLLTEGSQSFDDRAEYWGLVRDTARFLLGSRRKLTLKSGIKKEFETARAAAPAVPVEVTEHLQALYRAAIVLELGRDYTFGWNATRGHLCWSKYQWDARPLHLGELGDGEKNVNRAIFKAPIPPISVTDQGASVRHIGPVARRPPSRSACIGYPVRN